MEGRPVARGTIGVREGAVRVQVLGRLRIRPAGAEAWRLGSVRAESLLGYRELMTQLNSHHHRPR